MRRWLRFGLIGVGGLALIAVVAVALFVMKFDPNAQKDRIIDAVRRATGRELVLAGPLRLSLGWTPTIEAEDAALSNRPGGSRPQMATVARLEASVALIPLLSRRVEIESVTLDRPDILLETDSQGIGNWQFERPVAVAGRSGPSGGSGSRTVVAVHRLVVQNGRVTWRNEASGRVTTVDVPHATLRLDRGQDTLVADAQTSGQAMHLNAIMVSDRSGPWPVKVALDVAGAHVAAEGAVVLPLSEHSYSGKLDATVPDLAVLGSILKLSSVPPLHDVRVGMRLNGTDPMPQDITLHVGASDLGAYLPGATVAQLDLAVPALGQAGRVTGDGAMSGGPWHLASGITVNRRTIAFRALKLNTPGAALAGDVALSQGDRWALRGTVLSERLDMDWLRQVLRSVPASVGDTPAMAAPAPSTPAAPPPPRVFSNARLPWASLRAADADLEFSVDTLRFGGADYRGLSGHMSLMDGVLRLDPLAVQAPEGRIDGSLSADASQPQPTVALTLRSAAFALDPLLLAAGLPGGSDAPVEVDVALSGAGQSLHDLVSHLDGHVGLAMVDGTVANAALAAAFGDLVPKGAGRLDAAGRSPVRCLAIRLDAQAGQVNMAALDLDTSRLGLEGSGSVNLADETLGLRLRPTVRVGGTGILAPVRVGGDLDHPSASLDAQGVEGRSGIVIGGAPAPDACPAALTLARDGRAGRMPGPAAATKAPKVSDLLRSFLR
jgi:uncharacterized protein involved in outer membrane biogenesis